MVCAVVAGIQYLAVAVGIDLVAAQGITIVSVHVPNKVIVGYATKTVEATAPKRIIEATAPSIPRVEATKAPVVAPSHAAKAKWVIERTAKAAPRVPRAKPAETHAKSKAAHTHTEAIHSKTVHAEAIHSKTAHAHTER